MKALMRPSSLSAAAPAGLESPPPSKNWFDVDISIYNFAGVDATVGTSTTSLALKFSPVLINLAGTPYVANAPGTAPYSIGIYYTNTLTGDSGTLYYTYTATA